MRSGKFATKLQQVMGTATLIAAVACTGSALAQSRTSSTSSSQGSNSISAPVQSSGTSTGTGGNVSGNVTNTDTDASGMTLAGQDMVDKAFLRRTIGRGVVSMQIGEMALDKSSNDAVKKIAAMVIHDGTRLNDAFVALSKSMGVDTPQTLNKNQSDIVARLQKLNGAEFDAEYVKVTLRYQKEMDEAFHREANYAANADLKNITTHAAPVLHTHRERVEQIAQVVTTEQAAAQTKP